MLRRTWTVFTLLTRFGSEAFDNLDERNKTCVTLSLPRAVMALVGMVLLQNLTQGGIRV